MTLKTSYLLLTFISAGWGIAMFERQNRPGCMGGPICKAKGFWLYYTIYNWFLTLPLSLYLIPEAPLSHRHVWLTFTLSMWIRGIAEMYMLFVSKNWTPIIGISHDILTFLLMVGVLLMSGFAEFNHEPVMMVFTLSLFVSICTETYYAYSFYQIMKGRTQGEDGMWYAHEDDPRFKRIILVTTIFNYLLYGALIAFVLKYLI
jgi:hypothetical protein